MKKILSIIILAAMIALIIRYCKTNEYYAMVVVQWLGGSIAGLLGGYTVYRLRNRD